MPHKRTPEGLAESMLSQPRVLVSGELHSGIAKPKLVSCSELYEILRFDQASGMLQAANSNPESSGKK